MDKKKMVTKLSAEKKNDLANSSVLPARLLIKMTTKKNKRYPVVFKIIVFENDSLVFLGLIWTAFRRPRTAPIAIAGIVTCSTNTGVIIGCPWSDKFPANLIIA